jgi:integral membrane protein
MIMHNPSRAESDFRTIAIVEGWSYVILLCIAMPLKRMAGLGLPVKITGWIHGILFVAYCALLLRVWLKQGWSFGKVVLAFIVSLIPLGTFWFERKYLTRYI